MWKKSAVMLDEQVSQRSCKSTTSSRFNRGSSPLFRSISRSSLFSSQRNKRPASNQGRSDKVNIDAMAPDDLRAMISLSLESAAVDNIQNHDQEDDQVELQWYILHPHQNARCVWDLCTLILLFFAAIQLPLVICFHIKKQGTLFHLVVFQETFFLCDIILNFLTAYENNGKIVTKVRRIGAHYLRTWFLVDAAAAVGFPLLFLQNQQSRAISLITLLKVLRVSSILRFFELLKFLRINRILCRLDYSFILRQHVLHIMHFVVVVLLICHVFACVFHLLAARNRKDGEFRRNTWIVAQGLENASIADRYVAALYFVTMTVRQSRPVSAPWSSCAFLRPPPLASATSIPCRPPSASGASSS